MVENTIQAIKETEAKADAVVREAESKYKNILDEAAKSRGNQVGTDSEHEAEGSIRYGKGKRKRYTGFGFSDVRDSEGSGSAQGTCSAEAGGCGESCGIGADLGYCPFWRMISNMIFQNRIGRREGLKGQNNRKDKGGIRLWRYCRCSESVSAH